MNGLYIYLLYSTACAYKLEYDFFKFNKKVNNIDRLFFKRYCLTTGEFGGCTVTIKGCFRNFKYNYNIKFNPITIFIFPLIPVYNIILITVLMEILCSNKKADNKEADE